jgi:tetratricopeptide (TPR) repeat protein
MLFDLRGRGRRRTIQVIYASLALLMGGGLVFFGIGGNTSGGLFDAFQSNSGQSADETLNKRLDNLEERTERNPRDAQAWAELARTRFSIATTGENYNQTTQSYTDKGKEELQRAAAAWQRYLSLDPEKPNAAVANQMVLAYGPSGLADYEQAVKAMEIVIDQRDPTSALYAQLAILAHGAKQTRKSDLAKDKAVELAPKSQRAQVRSQIDASKAQIDGAAGGAGAAGAGTPEPTTTGG